jgi:ADP-heptose:LPS heptosyltransferase
MTPAVKSLREQFPEAEIYFAHSEWVSRMVSYLPHLAGDILFENVYDSSVFGKLKGTLKFIRKIRKMNFDLVLYGHRSNKLSLVLSLCGIKYRLGFDGTKYLTHTAPFRADLREYERYQTTLSKIGIKIIPSLPELKKPDVSKKRAELGIQPRDILIGIFPGGGQNPGTEMFIKKWGFGNYIELVKRINKKRPEIRIIIFEGKEESERIEVPQGLAVKKKKIDNDCLACCDYFISGDTGSLHIAAAFGVSTISLFGPTDPRILAPADEEGKPPKHAYIWKQPECSPCYTPATAVDKKNPKYWNGKNFLCHKGNVVCMSSITLDEVFNKIEMMLETHNQHH